ncbi:hypothetical protein QR680_000725 [Steinernema hermaphroditum]|uniref:RRM domain-containing protein n=1 Tax=Steinernema hermaphroditum TaxID=289476 RepID=A0AA39GVP0_9BILA|nr:hypothetical protein QR680_000725 [Steinernema hermaphroditum]
MSRVYVGRVPYRARESDLERFFRGYGRIREILMKNGYAFVEFSDVRDAEDAIHDLNGKTILRCPSNWRRVVLATEVGMEAASVVPVAEAVIAADRAAVAVTAVVAEAEAETVAPSDSIRRAVLALVAPATTALEMQSRRRRLTARAPALSVLLRSALRTTRMERTEKRISGRLHPLRMRRSAAQTHATAVALPPKDGRAAADPQDLPSLTRRSSLEADLGRSIERQNGRSRDPSLVQRAAQFPHQDPARGSVRREEESLRPIVHAPEAEASRLMAKHLVLQDLPAVLLQRLDVEEAEAVRLVPDRKSPRRNEVLCVDVAKVAVIEAVAVKEAALALVPAPVRDLAPAA